MHIGGSLEPFNLTFKILSLEFRFKIYAYWDLLGLQGHLKLLKHSILQFFSPSVSHNYIRPSSSRLPCYVFCICLLTYK